MRARKKASAVSPGTTCARHAARQRTAAHLHLPLLRAEVPCHRRARVRVEAAGSSAAGQIPRRRTGPSPLGPPRASSTPPARHHVPRTARTPRLARVVRLADGAAKPGRLERVRCGGGGWVVHLAEHLVQRHGGVRKPARADDHAQQVEEHGLVAPPRARRGAQQSHWLLGRVRCGRLQTSAWAAMLLRGQQTQARQPAPRAPPTGRSRVAVHP